MDHPGPLPGFRNRITVARSADDVLFRNIEYPNLPILAQKAGKTGYIKHATVVRKAGGEGTEYPAPVQDVSGPGTALMEIDQAVHRAVGVAAALVTAWITLRKGGRR
ncbi:MULTISPECIES: hypothetical protein [unclassified Streptomyces]|uniref:hypothetical protein n=1 Tax=unclassified Streptomyces TaxID=2593676 RepID=UPI001F0BA57D|nr:MULTISPECIES: hypothetical protein [unclassified Streptomyces]